MYILKNLLEEKTDIEKKSVYLTKWCNFFECKLWTQAKLKNQPSLFIDNKQKLKINEVYLLTNLPKGNRNDLENFETSTFIDIL